MKLCTEEPATGVHELKRHLLRSNVFGGKGHGEGQGIGRDKRKTVIWEYITFALLGTKSHCLFCRSFSQSKQSRIPLCFNLESNLPFTVLSLFLPIQSSFTLILPSRYHLIPKNGQVTSFLKVTLLNFFLKWIGVLQQNIKCDFKKCLAPNPKVQWVTRHQAENVTLKVAVFFKEGEQIHKSNADCIKNLKTILALERT